MLFESSKLQALLLCAPVTMAAATIRIDAGLNGLAFTPDSTKANVGDVLEFHFHPINHSVVMGDKNHPCAPAASGGFFSGFMPVSSGEGVSTSARLSLSLSPQASFRKRQTIEASAHIICNRPMSSRLLSTPPIQSSSTAHKPLPVTAKVEWSASSTQRQTKIWRPTRTRQNLLAHLPTQKGYLEAKSSLLAPGHLLPVRQSQAPRLLLGRVAAEPTAVVEVLVIACKCRLL